MFNAFDITKYPTSEPDTLVSGDRWVWRRDDISAIYNTDDYSLEYRLFDQASGSEEQIIEADVVDGVFVVQFSGTDSSEFAAGTWHWSAIIIRLSDLEEAVVNRGYFEVTSSATTSHVLKVLNAIRATIEGTASEEQHRIEINGRTLERRSIADLTELERMYSRRWAEERSKIARSQGRSGKSSRVLIKMGA
jgi:hypothetical protein